MPCQTLLLLPIQELGLAVNAAKRELDALKSREEELKRQRVQQKGEGSQVGGGIWWLPLTLGTRIAWMVGAVAASGVSLAPYARRHRCACIGSASLPFASAAR